jgi:uncharacterized protein
MAADTSMEQRGPFIHRFYTSDNRYVYDVNTNLILKVSPVIYDVIPDYGVFSSEEILSRHSFQHGVPAVAEAIQSIDTASRLYGLFSTSRPRKIRYPLSKNKVKAKLDTELSYFILECTEQCNLRCRYCLFSGHYPSHRKHSYFQMPAEVAFRAIDYLIAHSAKSEKVSLGFYGGEPLINFPLIQEAVGYLETLADGKPTSYHLTTNGTLLGDDEIRQFLIQKGFYILVSLDGPQDRHDRNRVYAHGGGTYQTIVTNLRLLKQENPEFYDSHVGISMVHAPPMDYLELDTFVSTSDLISPIRNLVVSSVYDVNTTYFERFKRWMLSDEEGLDVLRAKYRDAAVSGCFNEGLPKDLIFVRWLFDPVMALIHKRYLSTKLGDQYYPGGMCLPGVRRAFVRVNGEILVCEKCMDYGGILSIGDVWNGIDPDKVYKLLDDYCRLTEKECCNCWANRMCWVCAERATRDNRLDPDAKREYCQKHRQFLDHSLRFYCSILEKNIESFSFMKNILIS